MTFDEFAQNHNNAIARRATDAGVIYLPYFIGKYLWESGQESMLLDCYIMSGWGKSAGDCTMQNCRGPIPHAAHPKDLFKYDDFETIRKC